MSGFGKGVWVFLAIAFGIAWANIEIVMAMGVSLLDPKFQLYVVPAFFSPAIAAIVVRKWVTREGFADAGLRLNLRRWPYYVVAWLLPIPVVAAITAIAIVVGAGAPDFTMERAIEALAAEGRPLPITTHNVWVLAGGALASAIPAALVLWGEEFGWRGYLQKRLYPEQPVRAAVLVGIIWSVWHFPAIVRGFNFPDHPILGLLVFPVGGVLVSIIFAWLQQRSGSIWCPSLAHASTNGLGGSLTLVLFYGGSSTIVTSYVGMLGWIPLGALCAWIIATRQLQPQSAVVGGPERGHTGRHAGS